MQGTAMNWGQSSTGQARHGHEAHFVTYVALKEEKASIRLYTWSTMYTLPLSCLARNSSLQAAAYVRLLLLSLTQFVAVRY
jgi:hypothetical protein